MDCSGLCSFWLFYKTCIEDTHTEQRYLLWALCTQLFAHTHTSPHSNFDTPCCNNSLYRHQRLTRAQDGRRLFVFFCVCVCVSLKAWTVKECELWSVHALMLACLQINLKVSQGSKTKCNHLCWCVCLSVWLETLRQKENCFVPYKLWLQTFLCLTFKGSKDVCCVLPSELSQI